MNLTMHDKVATTVALAVGVEIVSAVIKDIAGDDISTNIGDEEMTGDALAETVSARIQVHLGVAV